ILGAKGVVVGGTSQVSGTVGGCAAGPSGFAILMNSRAKVDGSVRSGGNVRLDANATITQELLHAVGTTVSQSPTASVGENVEADPELPATLPTPSAITCPTGGANFNGAAGQTLSLPPGAYGALTFGGQFTLNLTEAGMYTFDSIATGN